MCVTGHRIGKWNLNKSLKPQYGLILIATLLVGMCGLALCTLNLDFLEAQERGDLLSVKITMPKSISLPKSRNPSYVMSLEKIQQLLIKVAQKPGDKQFIETALDGIEVTLADLLAMRLLRKQDELYVIGFSLFTTHDQRMLREVCGHFAENLAEAYIKRRAEFEKIMSNYQMKNIDSASESLIGYL